MVAGLKKTYVSLTVFLPCLIYWFDYRPDSVSYKISHQKTPSNLSFDRGGSHYDIALKLTGASAAILSRRMLNFRVIEHKSLHFRTLGLSNSIETVPWCNIKQYDTNFVNYWTYIDVLVQKRRNPPKIKLPSVTVDDGTVSSPTFCLVLLCFVLFSVANIIVIYVCALLKPPTRGSVIVVATVPQLW